MMRELKLSLGFGACTLSFNGERVGVIEAMNNANLRGSMFNGLHTFQHDFPNDLTLEICIII